MLCPKCGNDNPDEVQICESCSCDIPSLDIEQPKTKVKASLMVICSALLAGLAGVLTLFIKPTLAFCVALLSCGSAIAAIIEIMRSRKKLKGKIVAVIVLIFGFTQILLLSYWRIDASSIPDDYTVGDMRSASAKYNQTYELLKTLDNGDEYRAGAPSIGLSLEDVKKSEKINDIFKEGNLKSIAEQLRHYEHDILLIWQNAEKGREIFVKLDSFPEIADLKEVNFDIERPWLIGLRRLIFLYRDYICLQSCQGNHETAIEEFMRLDSIARKLSLNARSIIMKLVCYAWLSVDVQVANFIINNSLTPHDTLLILKQHVKTFSKKHMSLRNAMIYDYLSFKNELINIANTPRLKYSAFSPLKLNSTLRLLRNFFDKFIAIDEDRDRAKLYPVWPSIYPNLPVSIVSGSNLPLYYRLYNPVGYESIKIITPAIEKVNILRKNLEVRLDLLRIILDMRLGEEGSLKARAYSDEYIIDVENRKIFSPGPDGETDTKDDIMLPINPEVLHVNSSGK